ncbi:MAG: hypothetical protein J5585_06565 [Clostridia bacterium]|nr:hypothetical protein [Clostridia bacterium]
MAKKHAEINPTGSSAPRFPSKKRIYRKSKQKMTLFGFSIRILSRKDLSISGERFKYFRQQGGSG